MPTSLCSVRPLSEGDTARHEQTVPVLRGLQWTSSSHQFPPVPALRPVTGTGLWPGVGVLGFSGCWPCPAGAPNPADEHPRLLSVETGAVQGRSDGGRYCALPEKSYLMRPIHRFFSLSLMMSP